MARYIEAFFLPCVLQSLFLYLLAETKQKLDEVTSERDRLKEEKAQEVAALNSKLVFARKSYEAIIKVEKRNRERKRERERERESERER